jgi:hypothetical protein
VNGTKAIVDVENLVALRAEHISHDSMGLLRHHREGAAVDVEDRRELTDRVAVSIYIEQMGSLVRRSVGNVPLDFDLSPASDQSREHAIADVRCTIGYAVDCTAYDG